MKSIICLTFLFAVGYTSPLESPCTEPKKIGPCRGAMPRFFFDSQTSTCRPFFYGGCQGNGNNFKSLQACLQTCGSVSSSTPATEVRALEPVNDACAQEKRTGPCRGAHPRFFFNAASGRCEVFLFGGCEGNQNNFRSLEQCDAACSPASTRSLSTPAALPSVPVHACHQEKETGPCRAALRRFFFNQQSGQCEEFIYGGCEGNENNFRTVPECNSVCSAASASSTSAAPQVRVMEVVESSTSDDICSLGAEMGPCYASFPRFFHNRETGRCEEFIYGGCHGNDNNFRSGEECEAVCGNHVIGEKKEEKDPAVVCALPSDDGGCRAAFPMYFFNKESNACEEFIYGGCKGNDNRFFTKESCDQFCKPVMQ